MHRAVALIVDDEADLIELMQLSLSRMNIQVLAAKSIREAKHIIDSFDFDFCLTDLSLPDGQGLELVSLITKKSPNIPVAVITAYGSMDVAIEALKLGAMDFVNKPLELTKLRQLVEQALKIKQTATATSQQETIAAKWMVGQAPAIIDIRMKLAKLARSQAPVHISGESGTGKEVAAKLLHELSVRSDGPFVGINCGAIPSELMESEFFGHKKGSFTGATEDKIGLFQSAEGGTLFLDEVADLPLHMQVKLLRVIQEKKVRPIGAMQEVHLNTRIVSASHKSLGDAVTQGLFRQDLYYRLNVVEIHMPPLRERIVDLPLLVDTLLERICQDWGVEKPQLSSAVMQQLMQYLFPGNIRELNNILERALSLSDHQQIDVDMLDLPKPSSSISSGMLQTVTSNDDWGTQLQLPVVSELPNELLQHLQNTELPVQGLESYLLAIERVFLLRALTENRWHKTLAAKKLGLSFEHFVIGCKN